MRTNVRNEIFIPRDLIKIVPRVSEHLKEKIFAPLPKGKKPDINFPTNLPGYLFNPIIRVFAKSVNDRAEMMSQGNQEIDSLMAQNWKNDFEAFGYAGNERNRQPFMVARNVLLGLTRDYQPIQLSNFREVKEAELVKFLIALANSQNALTKEQFVMPIKNRFQK